MPFDATPIESKPDVFSLDGLIAWLETQDPETEYFYTNERDCVLCRYFRARGVPVFSLSRSGFNTAPDAPNIKYPGILADAAIDINDQSTYGAALSRARKLRGY